MYTFLIILQIFLKLFETISVKVLTSAALDIQQVNA